MSTKTTFKRIALVAVAALGFGTVSAISPANAVGVSFTTNATSYTSVGTSPQITVAITLTADTGVALASGESLTVSTVGVPVGTTAQRSDVQGAIRFNTDDVRFESYDGTTWNTLAYGTLSDFPTGDYGDTTTTTTDAFGVASATTFDCGAAGTTTTTDLEVLS